MLHQALHFLLECIQGPCLCNQRALIDSNVVKALEPVFRISMKTDQKEELKKQHFKVADDAVKICIGLIDGDKPRQNFPFTSVVLNNINFLAVINMMIEGFKEWKTNKKVYQYSSLTFSGFDAYILLVTLQNNSDHAVRFIKEAWGKIATKKSGMKQEEQASQKKGNKAPSTREANEANVREISNAQKREERQLRRFYEARTLSIEIANERGELQIARFPRIPLCYSLSARRKRKFLAKVDITSHQSKVKELFQEFYPFLKRSEGHHAMQKKTWLQVVRCVYDYRDHIHAFFYLWMVALNVLLLINAQPYADEYMIEPEMLGMWNNVAHAEAFWIISWFLIVALTLEVLQ